MGKSSLKVIAGILIIASFCPSCTHKQPPAKPKAESNPSASPQVAALPPAREANVPPPSARPASAPQPAPADPNVVALIGDYVITGDDFKKDYLQHLRPNPYSGNPIRPTPELAAVLMRMLGDKAVILEARQQGMNKKAEIQVAVKRMRQQRLASKVLAAVVEPQISVSDQDVNSVMAANPKFTQAQARAQARNLKGREAFTSFYSQLVQNRHLRKVAEDFPRTAAIHKRLLAKPKKGNTYWILNDEVRDDIDPNDKALVLATYDGGTFTVKEWFEALCDIAPPGRPKDLDTPEGVERFLDRSLPRPLLVAEAEARGMDKDPELVKALRKMEDDMVFGYAQQEKVKGLAEPNDQDIRAYYEQAKDVYGKRDILKLDVIWCEDRAAAAKARADLDQGKDFKAVQQQYTVNTKATQDKKVPEPFDVSSGDEGPFWQDLSKSEPNQVAGPILGFREGGLSWRVVKVIEKRPGKAAEFERAKDMIKSDLTEQRQQALLDKVRADLLQKFPHQAFVDRLRAFDPRNVP